MRYTIEYRRDGHAVLSRMHTNSYAAAQKHLQSVAADTNCTDVKLIDREALS